MQIGKLYFVKDEFYERFKDYGLLENKIIVDGKEHNRPCCYLFKFKENNEDIYWLIPISSQVTKYEEQYQHSMEKYGMCDNISFGYVLGERCAFLPQNLRFYHKTSIFWPFSAVLRAKKISPDGVSRFPPSKIKKNQKSDARWIISYLLLNLW